MPVLFQYGSERWEHRLRFLSRLYEGGRAKIARVRLDDDPKGTVQFQETADGVLVKEEFEAETENDPELQRQGWQAILDNFASHVGSKMKQKYDGN